MDNDTTMSAPAAAGGKLRLSEIISAIRAHEVELDCKAVLAFCDADRAIAVFDFNRCDAKNSDDLQLANVAVGVGALMAAAMCFEPHACEALAGAAARNRVIENALETFSAGKEDCHE